MNQSQMHPLTVAIVGAIVGVTATALSTLAWWNFTTSHESHEKSQADATAFYAAVNRVEDDLIRGDRNAFDRDAPAFQSLLNTDHYKNYLGIDDRAPSSDLNELIRLVSSQVSTAIYYEKSEQERESQRTPDDVKCSCGSNDASHYIGASYTMQGSLEEEFHALRSTLIMHGLH